ncbi:MAG TPA: hypothetical protein VIK78_00260 [Ruminiclostridium sp.]
MGKQEEYEKELKRWNELFAIVDEQTKSAADGLIQKAAFIHSMCWELEQAIELSGAIIINPQNAKQQKNVPAVKEYAKLAESYSNIVKKLDAIRTKSSFEGDDELDDYD